MPVHYPQCAGKPYRPSNGTEGEMFQERYCYRCIKDKDENCEILGNVFFLDINDPEYPKEWVYDADGKPTCTAFDDGLTPKPAYRCPDTPDLFGDKP